MDNIYDWNEEYELLKQRERAQVLINLNKLPEHDLEMLDEVQDASTMSSIDKIGSYQFFHNQNHVAMRNLSDRDLLEISS